MKRNPLMSVLPPEMQRQLGQAIANGEGTLVLILDRPNIDSLFRGNSVMLHVDEPFDGLIVLMNADAVKAAYDEHDSGRNGGAP